MNCEEVMELMQRHVDEDLDEQETSRMMSHVGHCPECAAILERLVQLSRGLEHLPRVVPPYSLVDAILPELGKLDAAGAESGAPAAIPPRSRRVERRRRAWFAGLGAVVALGVFAGLLMNGPLNGDLGANRREAASSQAASEPLNKTFSAAGNGDTALTDGTVPETPSAAFVNPDSATTKSKRSSDAPKADPSSKVTGTSTGNKGTASDSPVARSADTPAPSQRNVAKGLAANPSPRPSDPANLMGTGTNEEAVSPDGRWKAVLTDGALQVFDLRENAKVYESAPGDGKRSRLVWSEDSSAVDFTFTNSDGKQSNMTLVLAASEMKETER